ncbi:hypothetical protein KY285_005850 [Solanum tuberosum]|nr:hypothetical protein KY289_006303 [Solanum tuberosum]KAH0752702.1 hypothetical protein KY285_005850 [Solanum tuberosum]
MSGFWDRRSCRYGTYPSGVKDCHSIAEGRERAESMCSNFWPCTDHPMDHGLNGHCLKGLCPGARRPPPLLQSQY